MTDTPKIINAVGWPWWRRLVAVWWHRIRHPRDRAVFIKGYRGGVGVETTAWLADEWAESVELAVSLGEQLKEREREIECLYRERNEIDQVLGKALGYPEYDPADFGGVPNPPGCEICTGEHTAGTLADEAADVLKQRTELIDRLIDIDRDELAVANGRIAELEQLYDERTKAHIRTLTRVGKIESDRQKLEDEVKELRNDLAIANMNLTLGTP